jgi:hypothetical protein
LNLSRFRDEFCAKKFGIRSKVAELSNFKFDD